MKQVKLLAVIVFFIILVFSTNCYAEDYDKIREGDILTDGSVIGINSEKDLIISAGGEKEFKVAGKTNNTYIMKDVDMIGIEAHSTRWKVFSVTENENSIKLIIEPQYDIEVKDLKEGMDIKKGTIIKFPKTEGKQYNLSLVGNGIGYTANGKIDIGVEIGYNSANDNETGGGIWDESIENYTISYIDNMKDEIVIGLIAKSDLTSKDLYEGMLIKAGTTFCVDSSEWSDVKGKHVDEMVEYTFSLEDIGQTSPSISGVELLSISLGSFQLSAPEVELYERYRIVSIETSKSGLVTVILAGIKAEDLDFPIITSENSSLTAGEKFNDEIIKNEIIKNKISLLEKAINQGEKLSVEVKLENIETEKILESEINEIEKNADKDNIVQYFNIELLIKLGGEEIDSIEELEEELEFVIPISEELIKEGRKFYIIRVHNGKVEKIESTLKDGKLVFKTNKFSTYALAYEDVQEENINNEKDETPKTGAFDINLYVLGAMALVSVIVEVKSKTGKYSK